MNIKILRSGDEVGKVNVQERSISGDLPDTIVGAIEARDTTHTGKPDEITEKWAKPTKDEILRRLVSATQGNNLSLLFPDES